VRDRFERDTSDLTSRGDRARTPRAIADIVGAENVPYDGYGQRWGDPDIEANKSFVNAGFAMNDKAEVYGFGSYTATTRCRASSTAPGAAAAVSASTAAAP
jgi:iron complex outermembrane receptor protein